MSFSLIRLFQNLALLKKLKSILCFFFSILNTHYTFSSLYFLVHLCLLQVWNLPKARILQESHPSLKAVSLCWAFFSVRLSPAGPSSAPAGCWSCSSLHPESLALCPSCLWAHHFTELNSHYRHWTRIILSKIVIIIK